MSSLRLQKKWHNFHKHDMYGNIRSLDCVVKPEDYFKRAKELGHTHVFSTNHGYQGNIYEMLTLGRKYDMQVVAGVEAYFVPDRFEKDRRNFHLIIIALNHKGYLDINRVMSEANKTGYYYKPRIDEELLFSINPENVVITTACVAGVARESNADKIALLTKMKEHFGSNLFLEIQAHNHPAQIEHNKLIKKLSEQLEIEMISACDTHYIYQKDAKYREMFLKAKDINYPEEDGFILDYPDRDTLVQRYLSQKVFTPQEIELAIDNTLIFDKCTPLEIGFDIKLPKVSEDSVAEFKQLINKGWLKEREHIPKALWGKYLDAIRYESQIVLDTNMQDYFILDHKVVKIGVEKYGGVITRTGRGSAPSFYINKLLGLTDIDRLDCPITLYPTRFISTTRILETRSLPDIDLNLADRTPFIRATEDLLGEDGVHWLMSFKPLQDSSAFRLFCKAKGMHIDEYNEVAKNIEDYENDAKWKPIIEESKVFKGVVESVAPSPCSFLLLDKPISEEVGIVKVGDEYCANLDGYNCDVYKYLKNDYLSVTVWKIIDKVCKLANIPIPTIRELNELLDDETYKMYELGLTCTLNQADSNFGTESVKTLKPKSVGEMSAFVASIRPGFASLLDNFLNRRGYTTGVPQLDELLQDSYHYLMYQESIMKYLVWLGMEESKTYDIIKKISKKKFNPEELVQLKSGLKENWIIKVGSEEGFDETWKVIEDAANYSFNASHSLSVGLDSLYGAYLKSHYPLEYYSVALNEYAGDIERTSRLIEELKYFKIKLSPARFGYSKGVYFFDRETNTIYKGIGSIKFLNEQIGDKLYELSKNNYKDFMELLNDLTFINSKQLQILIKVGYFSDFGKTYELLQYVEIHNKYSKIKIFKTDNYMSEIVKQFAKKVTEKQLRDIDTVALCKYLCETTPKVDLPVEELIQAQYEYTGTVNYIGDFDKKECVILSLDTKYPLQVLLYQICSGKFIQARIMSKFLNENPVKEFDRIRITSTKKQQKRKKIDGKWELVNEFYYYVEYEKK